MRFALALIAIVCAGCGDDGNGPGKPGAGGNQAQVKLEATLTVTKPEPVEGVDPSAPGRIVGTVSIEQGKRPLPVPLTLVKNTAGCLEHGAEPPLREFWVVDDDGQVANVVVRLLRAPDAPPPPKTPFEIDQHGCLFVPHVVAVQAGRQVRVTNSDGISHNVRLTSARNRERNETIGPGGDPVVLDLLEAERCALGCDIHPWMGAHLIVVEHPWFAVSAADGSFAIEDIPPGTYGLEIWHEQGGRIRQQKLEVAPGTTVRAEIVYR